LGWLGVDLASWPHIAETTAREVALLGTRNDLTASAELLFCDAKTALAPHRVTILPRREQG